MYSSKHPHSSNVCTLVASRSWPGNCVLPLTVQAMAWGNINSWYEYTAAEKTTKRPGQGGHHNNKSHVKDLGCSLRGAAFFVGESKVQNGATSRPLDSQAGLLDQGTVPKPLQLHLFKAVSLSFKHPRRIQRACDADFSRRKRRNAFRIEPQVDVFFGGGGGRGGRREEARNPH